MSIDAPAGPIFGPCRFLSLLFLCGALVAPLAGQTPSADVPPIRRVQISSIPFDLDGATVRSWEVIQAELEEGAMGTLGTLQVRNARGAPVEWAKFYVEYYDARGRPCFTLLFATYQHRGEESGPLKNDPRPVASGESRTLLSDAFELAPALKVSKARVHLISQATLGKGEEVVAGNGIIRSPAAIEGTILERQIQLTLPDPQARGQAASDLVLAQVAISKEGIVKGAAILDSASPEAAAWLQRAIHGKAIFRPATAGFVNVDSRALVLVRAIKFFSDDPSVPLASSSAWVRVYADTLSDRELPPVTELIFLPMDETVPHQPKPPGSPDANSELFGAGSFWCDSLLVWDPVSSAHPWTLRWRSTQE